MFLSVIISCYNSKKYIKRVLNSLVAQDFDNMEVIISDDNSTDNFMEIVNKYSQLLNIKYFKTKPREIHCPGNTRLDGWSHASGEWITFIDHDDAFIPGAFNTVHQVITTSDVQYPFLYSPVQQVDANGNNIKVLDAITWLHGNFYNRQWLIDNKINFKEDLFGNEDLYFNATVNGTIAATGGQYWSVNTPLYRWYSIPESLSNIRNDASAGYTEKYFGDYLTAALEPHFNLMEKYPGNENSHLEACMNTMINCYFYCQRALYNNGETEEVLQMKKDCAKWLHKIVEWFHITVNTVIDHVTHNLDAYIATRDIIFTASGKFIEQQSIKEYIQTLWIL